MTSASPSHVVTVTRTDRDLMRLWTIGAVVIAIGAVWGQWWALPTMPMPSHRLGIVGPTCGLTRGTLAFMAGDVGEAWRWNPASVVLVPLVFAGLVRVGFGTITGRWPNLRVRWTPAVIGIVIVAIGALWLNQQHNADLIIGP